METKRCFIFGAGDACPLVSAPADCDLVIAADGGQALCAALGVEPQLTVGDFDSSAPPPSGNVVRLPVHKDDTDTLRAVRLGLERGCTEFHIYGGLGGRLGHTLANLQTLLLLVRRGARGRLYGPHTAVEVIENSAVTLPAAGGVSVFSMGGTAEGVTITGCEYPLHDAVLTPDFPLGVSNRAVQTPVTIAVRQGALAIVWEI
ncbi:MAG: thiamine diphosphokinase [Oscillospiraceae bacterium]|nr:thiamine diphosphokinase [Oscillospiraceae bacterium]